MPFQTLSRKQSEVAEFGITRLTLYSRLNDKDNQDFLKTVGFHQEYSDIKTPAPGFDFETSSAQPSVLPFCQPFEFQ